MLVNMDRIRFDNFGERDVILIHSCTGGLERKGCLWISFVTKSDQKTES